MTGTVRLQGRDIRYVVRQSARARRLSLRIRDASGVEVIVPARLKLHGVESVLQRKAPWILRTLERVAHHQSSGPLATLEDGMRLPLLEEELTLRIVRVTGRRIRVSSSNGEIVVSLPAGGSGDVRLPLIRWYFARAKVLIPRRVEELNKGCGFSYESVTVRNQKTRWGSCSRHGTLSFNWRLLILPTFVADYLIFHELAHLSQLNHSIRFWRIVGRICPFYREAERWLRRNGRSVLL
jgi:predicted metal-dependent hydrolase